MSMTEVCVALTAAEGQKRFLPVALKHLVGGESSTMHDTFYVDSILHFRSYQIE